MSHQDDKLKNSTRRHQDESAVKKQLTIAKNRRHIAKNHQAIKEPHRLVKHHLMDCGNPECFLCGNPRKLHKDKLTAQEKRIFQDIDTLKDKHSNGLLPPEE